MTAPNGKKTVPTSVSAVNALTFRTLGQAGFANRANSVSLTSITSDKGFRAIGFHCGMNKDVDGAPTCYGPQHPPALEFIGNATNHSSPVFHSTSKNTWQWVGLIAKTESEALRDLPGATASNLSEFIDRRTHLKDVNGRFPVFQRAPQPAPGFYVSSTATAADTRFEAWDQRRYWNAAEIPYQALTPALANHGVRQGDFGFAIRNKTGMLSPFLFADAGNKPKVGECSLNLFQTMFPNYPSEDNEQGITYIVFPGSRLSADKAGWEVVAGMNGAVRAQLRKLDDVVNSDELILFIVLKADLLGLRRTLAREAEGKPGFPTAEFNSIGTTVGLLWCPTNGNFKLERNSPQLK